MAAAILASSQPICAKGNKRTWEEGRDGTLPRTYPTPSCHAGSGNVPSLPFGPGLQPHQKHLHPHMYSLTDVGDRWGDEGTDGTFPRAYPTTSYNAAIRKRSVCP